MNLLKKAKSYTLKRTNKKVGKSEIDLLLAYLNEEIVTKQVAYALGYTNKRTYGTLVRQRLFTVLSSACRSGKLTLTRT